MTSARDNGHVQVTERLHLCGGHLDQRLVGVSDRRVESREQFPGYN